MKLLILIILLSTTLQFTAQNYIQTNYNVSNLNNTVNNPIQMTSNIRASLSNVVVSAPRNRGRNTSRNVKSQSNTVNVVNQINEDQTQTRSANRGIEQNEQSRSSRGNSFNINVTWNLNEINDSEIKTQSVQTKKEEAPRKEMNLASKSLPKITLPTLNLNKQVKTTSVNEVLSAKDASTSMSKSGTLKLISKAIQKKASKIKSYLRNVFKKKLKTRFSVNCFNF